MKIKKAVNLYSLVAPRQTPDFGFFTPQGSETLYFKSLEEAQLYQKANYPGEAVKSEGLVAVEDRDKQGKDRWVLINKVENMRESNQNKAERDRYYGRYKAYEATAGLEIAIKNNPSSVIAVREVSASTKEDEGQFGGPSSTTSVYDSVDVVTADTRFLYVNGDERWFVERGPEITLVDASKLVKSQRITQIQDQQRQLDAERERLERELLSIDSAPGSRIK